MKITKKKEREREKKPLFLKNQNSCCVNSIFDIFIDTLKKIIN